ncbi:MAG: AvrD family protein [Leuconostoc gelidum]|uniref:AvrD family protein n=1 Tax=Leuconostoc gelidum TaxID=1244 RepID=UPI00157778BC|nr:AvrD family protein [Leuconostoc gelidum]MBZ5979425.1 hypothetical protein [Leuconostoc gelidum subsp. gelidum]MBZ6002309.1 hypothetical protein [Leuconostoc gelidum subsp. gelidum]QDJ30638.1 hypothetical protein BHS02_08395 [Leuconostoc gelidum subsp. gelidum]
MSNYKNIDDIIGNSSTRYFGEGYRNVKYDIISKNMELSSVFEMFNITYPDQWSVKNGQSINSHLSTIDGIILAVKSIEDYFIDLGIPYEELAQFKIHDLVIKAGKALKENLDGVAVNFLVKNPESETVSFKGKVGSFSVVVKLRKVSEKFSKTFTKEIHDYIFSEFKKSKICISDIKISEIHNNINAVYKINNEHVGSYFNGISNTVYSGELSVIDGIVIVAELTEALLLEINNVDRDNSNLLIMRKIHFHRPETEDNNQQVKFNIDVLKETIVSDRNMRLLDCEAKALGFNLLYSVAQEIGGKK